MEMKKTTDEAIKCLMSLIQELSQVSIEVQLGEIPLTEEKSIADEEMTEEKIYEEIFQEDPDEVSHVEDLNNTFVSMLPLDED